MKEELTLILSELTTNTEKVEKNQAFLLKAFETYVEEFGELEEKIKTIEVKAPNIDVTRFSEAVNALIQKHNKSNQDMYKAAEEQLNEALKKINKQNTIKEMLMQAVLPWLLIIPLTFFAIKFGHIVWMENLPYKTTVKYLKAANPNNVELIDSVLEESRTREGRKGLRKEIKEVTNN